jgi:DNA-binding LacI/PurR family transcriptional regulator
MDAMHAAGLLVPRDISVLGFTAVPDPDVTSIFAPMEEIGERAAAYLIDSLESGPAEDVSHQVAFETVIVQRGTTGAPAA